MLVPDKIRAIGEIVSCIVASDECSGGRGECECDLLVGGVTLGLAMFSDVTEGSGEGAFGGNEKS